MAGRCPGGWGIPASRIAPSRFRHASRGTLESESLEATDMDKRTGKKAKAARAAKAPAEGAQPPPLTELVPTKKQAK